MVPVVCTKCRNVFEAAEDRLKLTCPRCGRKMFKRSPSFTVATEVFGTSMPTIGRPGTGARTRSVGAPSLNARSFWRWTMRLTATPGAGSRPN